MKNCQWCSNPIRDHWTFCCKVCQNHAGGENVHFHSLVGKRKKEYLEKHLRVFMGTDHEDALI